LSSSSIVTRARAVVAREPDLVHAVVERHDPVIGHHAADIGDDRPGREREAVVVGAGQRALEDLRAQRRQRRCVRDAVGEALREQREARLDVADHLGMAKKTSSTWAGA
jgi:hypothetical protein